MEFNFEHLIGLGKAAMEVVSGGRKIVQAHEDKKEDERMREIYDQLRRSWMSNGANCLTAEIGSPEDRFYSKMVAKGYLVRSFGNGYLLADMMRKTDGTTHSTY
jgi:hypothetical protein